jgi:hypothetical protein
MTVLAAIGRMATAEDGSLCLALYRMPAGQPDELLQIARPEDAAGRLEGEAVYVLDPAGFRAELAVWTGRADIPVMVMEARSALLGLAEVSGGWAPLVELLDKAQQGSRAMDVVSALADAWRLVGYGGFNRSSARVLPGGKTD